MYRCVSWEVEILFVMSVRNCGRMYQCVSWEVEYFVMLIRNCGRMYQCVSWEVEILCHVNQELWNDVPVCELGS